MPHKVGNVVKVYEDPLAEKRLEGEAKLVELLQQDDEREYWLVEFTRGHERHPRWIKKAEGDHRARSSQSPGSWQELQQKELDLEAEIEETKDPRKLKRLQEELADVRGRQTQELQQRELEVEDVCRKLQYFIDEEEKGIAEYEEFWKVLDELGQKGYATGIIRIAEEERSHRQTLINIKKALCKD
jgi:hypothetical protein